MRLLTLSIFLAIALPSPGYSSLIQPAIAPNGVVNAASYVAPGFANHGIARGSLFVIFGNYLGPDTLAQAMTYPLPGSDGLAGTRVHIDAPGYSAYALMVYTSAKQVAAVLPSDAPAGDATLTLNYNTLTSNPVVIHIVRSAFGMFTLNQGGSGPAIAQNFVSATQTPVNTLLAPATPGQTVILWGTGLGPVNGDDASGPRPGALPYLDALYVGGQPATVRYAGRSGCCVAVDQISFDVPAGVSGCYVPVAAVTGGVVSNLGTIAVSLHATESSNGSTCDDPLNFRAASLNTLERAGRLRVSQIAIEHQSPPSTPNGTNSLNGAFVSYTPQSLMTAAPVNPSSGSCYATESLVNAGAPAAAQADALNAGGTIQSSGPAGLIMASLVSPGNYFGDLSPASLLSGVYSVSGPGGPDVGAFQGNFTVPSPGVWTNSADFSTPLVTTGQPFTFRWTGGDATGYVTIQLSSANATVSTSILCNAAVSANSFTVPGYLTRLLVQGGGSIAVGFATAPASFTASGLDMGVVTTVARSMLPANFQTPPGQ